MSSSTILRLSWAGTAVFTATAVAAVYVESVRVLLTGLAVTLFLLGSLVFLWAFFLAVERSRRELIGVGGLFFLGGEVAPAAIQRSLLGSIAAQTLVALGTASLRPFTALAFGILVPMWGLGLSGLWGAMHGTYAPREDI